VTSIYPDEYRRALALLVEARKASGMTQQQLAEALGRPQSFVSKFENGERRLDVAEFLNISRLVGADPCALLEKARVGQAL
jgi:transcriptional regulator with XRE-family HTH domain